MSRITDPVDTQKSNQAVAPMATSEKDTSSIPEEIHRKNREESHFFIANLFMCFIFPLVCKCRPLRSADIPECHTKDRTSTATSKFMRKFKDKLDEAQQPNAKKPNPSLIRILFSSLSSWEIPVALIAVVISVGFTACQPLMAKGVLKSHISKSTSTSTPSFEAFPYAYAILFILAPTLSAMFDTLSFRLVVHFSARVRSALVGAVYDKVFLLRNVRMTGAAGTGRIVSLVSYDARMIGEVLPTLFQLSGVPVSIIVPTVLLALDLYWVVVVSLVLIVIVLMVSFKIQSKAVAHIFAYLGHTDSLNSVLNETVSGIRTVKVLGLEKVFSKRITDLREGQVGAIQAMVFLMQTMTAVMQASPILVNFATLAVFCAAFTTDADVFAGRVMPSLGYLSMITSPATMIPLYMQSFMLIKMSLTRMSTFLALAERETSRKTEKNENGTNGNTNAVVIKEGEFGWGTAPEIPMTDAEVMQMMKDYAKMTAAAAAAQPVQESADTKQETSTEMETLRPSETTDTSNTPTQTSTEQTYPPNEAAPTVEQQTEDPAKVKGNSVLNDISITIPKGTLTMIVGSVGSGKSSLAEVLSGGLECLNGSVRVDGSVTFCAQSPWIANNTVRGNIVFGAKFDKSRYSETLRVCALDEDMSALAEGDGTMIGEKGVTLSGGQKARIQLARAVYAQKDILVVDDPLSAVDGRVGRFVMDECFCGVLKGKTVVMVTNELRFLDRADQVIVLEGGRIKAHGRLEELGKQGVDLSEYVSKQEKEKDNSEADKGEGSEVEKEAPSEEKDEAKNGLAMTEEEQQTGAIKFSSYLALLSGLMPSPLVAFFLIYVVLSESVVVVAQWWLGKVGPTDAFAPMPFWWKAGVYGLLGVLSLFLLVLRACFVRVGTGRFVRKTFSKLLQHVLASPTRFFDTTPAGRVLNRFVGDLPQVDQFLVSGLLQVMSLIVGLIGQVVVVGLGTPWLVAVGVPLIVVFWVMILISTGMTRDLQRLEAIGRSPVLSQVSETLGGAGVETIRSLGREEEWKEKFWKVNDDLSSRFVIFRLAQKWASLYSSVLASLMFAGVVLMGWLWMDVSQLSVCVLACLAFSSYLTALVNQTVDLEGKMTSFERVRFFSTSLPQESQLERRKVDEAWPQKGEVHFEDVWMKYGEDLPFVLKGVDFKVNGGEKIGVCGRTGAGKSSLAAVLFRLVELDPILSPKAKSSHQTPERGNSEQTETNSGRIVIDGVDISEVGVDRLRSSLGMIPQDPTLFAGTVRFNVDVRGEATDNRIWEVLELVSMKTRIESLGLGLDTIVGEDGVSFSAGERQLLCLARVLIRNCRIVLLDEATASVDVETDGKIQETIRTQLADKTVIVIAHRLDTITDMDRIIVMSEGKVAEFDTPDNLKANPNSVFSGLVNAHF
ncbi:Multidrug resistance-associated protein [Blattamonas nauphoetae]|uniref:Multidrug resistance-associated protein n=1 Tax=Blattamonas nauphoetae TaxID=2049346 RepID=A0ABQ9YGN5_9EUKA|nr:Multidrug resistance-associated protein [Blattamonas nauphoetae]